jgi:hypothetical protein
MRDEGKEEQRAEVRILMSVMVMVDDVDVLDVRDSEKHEEME